MIGPPAPLGRAAYAVAGLALTGLKLSTDRIVSELVFHDVWSPQIYLAPHGNRAYLLTLLAIAVPFVAAGTWLTLRRLRSAGWSPWLVLLFFVPLVNLAFFALLCVVPPRASDAAPGAGPPPPALQRWLPRSPFGAAVASALAAGVVAAVFVVLSTRVTVDYGWSVFVALPFAQGMLAVWLTGTRSGRVPSTAAALGIAALSTAITALLLLLFLIEGAICLAMVAPLALVLALCGGVAGLAVLRIPARRAAPLVLAAVALPAGLLGALPSGALDAPRYAVVTTVVVDAPPERVWPHVIAFPPLPPPQDAMFRSGIAYPQRARIDGRGRGAIRYCEFSTGAFVEPITAWEPARRLAFGVTRNPPPMRELSPFGVSIETAHLANYLVADAGEFRLTRLPGGRTELIGTTWYRHHLYPAAYWRLWSDAIIHRIHLRVLEHVARLSTAPGA
ncbi:MAG TPA: hypothetical protein VGC96_02580 [Candidatus Elarobacter sp.]|jgi:hypothetical protein